jgi:hypothetical protein
VVKPSHVWSRCVLAQPLLEHLACEADVAPPTTNTSPSPAVVVVDAFGAVAPDGIVRLFGRGRSAGMSLLLGPQELADLALAANPNLKDQVLGNLTTPIAHRQLIPDSAEQIAAIAGTQGTWVTSTVPSPSSLTSRPWSSPGG